MSLPVEDVRDYPRPPALEPAGARVVVRLGGAVAAESDRALRVLETHHAPTYYLPPEDVAAELIPCPGLTFCEWKGRAEYFDVRAGAGRARRAAWRYPRPSPRFRALANHLSFYAGEMDACEVGGVRVLPQPGDFYGGWLTPNLVGTVKGGPGTEGW